MTNIAGAAVAVYETSKKRDRWRDYANQGDVYSQYELAESLCCQPTDGPRNYEESFKWFCFAAKNGHARAQLKLGGVYEGRETLGDLAIQPDRAQSYAWYHFAAKRANSNAAARLEALQQQMTAEEVAQAQQLVRTTARYMACAIETAG